MSSVARRVRRRKKSFVLGEPGGVSQSELETMELDARAELMKQLIPLG